jgi:hypothetical protein
VEVYGKRIYINASVDNTSWGGGGSFTVATNWFLAWGSPIFHDRSLAQRPYSENEGLIAIERSGISCQKFSRFLNSFPQEESMSLMLRLLSFHMQCRSICYFGSYCFYPNIICLADKRAFLFV